MILALCTSAIAFAPPPRRGPRWTPLAYGRRDDADHDRWQATADALTAWRGDEETVSTFWRIDCDEDGFTWECGEWLCMDNFYLIDDNDDREWVAPSGALGHGRLVDVLDRKGMFSTKTYIECQGVAEGGVTIC